MVHQAISSVPFTILLVAAAPAAQEQAQPEQTPQDVHETLGRFSTGPPVEVPLVDAEAMVEKAARRALDDLTGREKSVPDGTDIRANQTLTSAQNETSLAVNPLDDQNWVGVANDYSLGSVQTGWYTTLDGGQTWTTGTFGIDPGFSFSGDPCVAFDHNGDPVVVCMMYFGAGGSKVTSFRSTDGGLTWSAGVNIDLDPANDKPQVEFDLSNGPGQGNITTAWDRFGTGTGDHIYVSTSTDGGVTWSTSQRINDAASTTTISPDVTHGPNSEIYVMWADRGINNIYLDKSTDNGVTWGTDTLVAPFGHVPSPIPGSSFRMFDIFSISADTTGGPFNGNVYVAYHTWNGVDANINCATSTDGGATFPTNVVVNASDGTNRDQVMPGICVDPKGNVNVSFYDRRLDSSDFLLWTWVGRSSDGGASFVNHRASDIGWNHQQGEFGGGFVGDYIDIDCSAWNVFPFWCEVRNNSQEVFVDVVNLDLYSDTDMVQTSAPGGRANFTINLGPNYAGMMYVLAASSSGTSPGLDVNGVHIPINYDNWTKLTVLKLANSAFFPNSIGILDATGSATSAVDTVGPRPILNGITLDWTVVVVDASFNPLFATDTTQTTFVP